MINRDIIGQLKKILLLLVLSVLLLACVTPPYVYVDKTSTIKDITYKTTLIDEEGHVKTTAYFVLEDGTMVPVSSNFNPSVPDSYVGKTLTYTSRILEGELLQAQTDINQNAEDYSEYICFDKYVQDGNCFLRIFTNKKPAIKTIQVNTEVYSRASKNHPILKNDIEPYIKKKTKL